MSGTSEPADAVAFKPTVQFVKPYATQIFEDLTNIRDRRDRRDRDGDATGSVAVRTPGPLDAFLTEIAPFPSGRFGRSSPLH